MKPFISTAVYGFFNYAIAGILIASPWMFGFAAAGGSLCLLSLYFGWLQLIMAIFSKHELGFIKVFPVSMHCFIDLIVGSFLFASPFLYGYPTSLYWPQLLIGAFLMLLGLFTKNSPVTDAPVHVFKDGLMEHTGDVDEVMTH